MLCGFDVVEYQPQNVFARPREHTLIELDLNLGSRHGYHRVCSCFRRGEPASVDSADSADEYQLAAGSGSIRVVQANFHGIGNGMPLIHAQLGLADLELPRNFRDILLG